MKCALASTSSRSPVAAEVMRSCHSPRPSDAMSMIEKRPAGAEELRGWEGCGILWGYQYLCQKQINT